MTAITGRYECDGCGACCRTWPVLVGEEDAQREVRITIEGRMLPEHLGSPYWRYQLFPMPFHEGCCFLDGERRCTIYATRPRVCREFVVGGERCQEARRLAGLPPLAPQPEA
jgi:Fe-S-cluster containining protein